jgi:multiple sugar transport system permease protein
VATVLAGVVLSMIPALIVFIFGQRPLREGLTAGTSK